MTRPLLSPAFVAIAALVLAACGADDDAANSQPVPTDPPPAVVADQVEPASPPPTLDESALWRRIDVRYDDLGGNPTRIQAILLNVEEDGVVDLTQPAPMRFGMRVFALDDEKTNLVLAISGSLGACHYLDGVEVDGVGGEVVLVPRLASKHGQNYFGSIAPTGEIIPSCPQPGVALAMLVKLDEPLENRPVRVLRCDGPGRDDCEEMAAFTADEITLAASVEVTCVPVEFLMEIQRDIYDRLDRCDPNAVPMLGIWE